jgi:hypothetical protein
MSSKYYGKPRLVEPWSAKRKGPNQACRKVSYRDGDAYECGHATEGKTYCPACAEKLLTLTDRPSPEQPAPKPYAWTQDQIFPRKRA